jgi:hypothetical protein
MKSITTLAIAVCAVITAYYLPGPTARAADTGTQEVMKDKLGHSQEILKGITTENFDLILLNAQKLNRLSHATGWFTRQTPEYELFTNELRRHTDSLGKAAKNKNLDAATLAYVQMTMSCVACHKYMRGAKLASLK